ncbi:hypothetical protein ABPG74_000095 [Tetrahymena malaccensis]
MKNYILAIFAITSVALCAYIFVQGYQAPVLQQNSFTTVRLWNQCSDQVPMPCPQCPKYEHPTCVDGFIDTNNCLLRDTQECTSFWDYVYNPSNIDNVLPDIMSQCINTCEKYAEKEKHLLKWFQQKFNSCAQSK